MTFFPTHLLFSSEPTILPVLFSSFFNGKFKCKVCHNLNVVTKGWHAASSPP